MWLCVNGNECTRELCICYSSNAATCDADESGSFGTRAGYQSVRAPRRPNLDTVSVAVVVVCIRPVDCVRAT